MKRWSSVGVDRVGIRVSFDNFQVRDNTSHRSVSVGSRHTARRAGRAVLVRPGEALGSIVTTRGRRRCWDIVVGKWHNSSISKVKHVLFDRPRKRKVGTGEGGDDASRRK